MDIPPSVLFVLSLVLARWDISATCSSLLDSIGISPAPLSTQKLLFFFHSAFPVKVLDNRSDSFSKILFHAMPALRNLDNLLRDREPSMSADNTQNLLGSTSEITFHHNPWQCRSRSILVSCDFLCRLRLKSYHLSLRATQAIPVRSIPCIVQWLSRPIF